MNIHPGVDSFDIDVFAERLAGAIQPSGGLVLQSDSLFREMEQWDSIASISTLAMLYAEYDVQISGDELVGCSTVAELFAVVAGKLGG